MGQKSGPEKEPAEQVIKQIRRAAALMLLAEHDDLLRRIERMHQIIRQFHEITIVPATASGRCA